MEEHEYVTQEELDDAICSDTCHCDLCGSSFVLGGGADYVIVTLEGHHDAREFTSKLGAQLKLCIECAGLVAKEYRVALAEACVCEHGLADTEYCEECNREYKRAYREHYGEDAGE